MLRLTTIFALLLTSLGSATPTSAQTGGLTAAELAGAWTLTFRPNPPGAGGVQITMTDEAGRPLQAVVVDLAIEVAGGRLSRCVTTEKLPGASRTPVDCRLERGALLLRAPFSGGGGGGSVSFRLSRTTSGALAGPASARAPLLPVSMKVGAVTMVRPA